MKVTSTSGAAPVKECAACVLRAMATGQQAECVAEIRCGTTVLWPASEPVTCTYEGARPATIAGGTAPATIFFLTPALEVKAKAFSAELSVAAEGEARRRRCARAPAEETRAARSRRGPERLQEAAG